MKKIFTIFLLTLFVASTKDFSNYLDKPSPSREKSYTVSSKKCEYENSNAYHEKNI